MQNEKCKGAKKDENEDEKNLSQRQARRLSCG